MKVSCLCTIIAAQIIDILLFWIILVLGDCYFSNPKYFTTIPLTPPNESLLSIFACSWLMEATEIPQHVPSHNCIQSPWNRNFSARRQPYNNVAATVMRFTAAVSSLLHPEAYLVHTTRPHSRIVSTSAPMTLTARVSITIPTLASVILSARTRLPPVDSCRLWRSTKHKDGNYDSGIVQLDGEEARGRSCWWKDTFPSWCWEIQVPLRYWTTSSSWPPPKVNFELVNHTFTSIRCIIVVSS